MADRAGAAIIRQGCGRQTLERGRPVPMKILITGSKGQLAQALQTSLAGEGTVLALGHNAMNLADPISEHERSLLWNDPELGIQWPIEQAPQLSGKDAAGKRLSEADLFPRRS